VIYIVIKATISLVDCCTVFTDYSSGKLATNLTMFRPYTGCVTMRPSVLFIKGMIILWAHFKANFRLIHIFQLKF
jgi:hypothetical protein